MMKVKIFAGIVWAIACLILLLLLFPGVNSLSGTLAKRKFMKINPNYTGGEIAWHYDRKDYSVDVRHPVFDGLIKEKKKGFVQVDWRGNIPDIINDTIDYDLDGKADVCIMIERNKSKTEITPLNSRTGKLLMSTPTSYGWAVRIALSK